MVVWIRNAGNLVHGRTQTPSGNRRVERLVPSGPARPPSGHGGRREGAGRPRGKNANVPHRTRPIITRRLPAHVTLRAIDGLPILDDSCAFLALVGAIRSIRDRAGFRVVLFSVQPNHIHMICEADSTMELSKGMQVLAARMARAFNRVFARKGSVWASRYHSRLLQTPLQVRRAIVYVLGNRRHHGQQHEPKGTIDPCSSARWFAGFRERLPPLPEGFVPPTSEAQSWLLLVGWKKFGLISVDEGPRPK
jgi:REP element-mobilizing transposase RayT